MTASPGAGGIDTVDSTSMSLPSGFAQTGFTESFGLRAFGFLVLGLFGLWG